MPGPRVKGKRSSAVQLRGGPYKAAAYWLFA